MISVQHLCKNYGSVAAVRDVSFEVAANEVVGFLGPNGAGKSTTLRIIAGFLGATRGRVVIDGKDIVEQAIEARARIGYMPENVPLYPEMRVLEYLRFRAQLKKVKRAERAALIDRAMHDTRIDDHADVPIGELSKGYRQRLGLADALVSRPPVLVLDEPTAGMDPNQIREMRERIRSLARDHTVLLSTHILSEVEATCDRALVIDRGRLVAQGALDDLRAMRSSQAARFVVRGDAAKAARVLSELSETARVDKLEEQLFDDSQPIAAFEVRWQPQVRDRGTAQEHAVAALVTAGLHVREASAVKATLEEVFSSLTEDATEEAGQ